MSNEEEIESERLQWVASFVRGENARFEAVGVHPEVLPLRVGGEGSRRESEVEVYFWRGGDLANAAAWPVYRQGRLLCSGEEWRDAVRRDLDGILSSSLPPEQRIGDRQLRLRLDAMMDEARDSFQAFSPVLLVMLLLAAFGSVVLVAATTGAVVLSALLFMLVCALSYAVMARVAYRLDLAANRLRWRAVLRSRELAFDQIVRIRVRASGVQIDTTCGTYRAFWARGFTPWCRRVADARPNLVLDVTRGARAVERLPGARRFPRRRD